MSLPSESDLRTAIGEAILLFDETEDFGVSNTPNYLGMWETYAADIPADSTPAAQSAVETHRATLASMLSTAFYQSTTAPLWLTYARVRDLPWTDRASIHRALFVLFAEAGTPVTVKSRGYTYGSVSASGSPTGTGTIVRCSVDSYGYTIESPTVAEVKTYECAVDEHTEGGVRHQEVFLVTGEARGKDALTRTGTGMVAQVQAISPYGQTAQFIKNAGFETFVGTTAVPTSLTNWSVTTIANVEMVTGTPGTEVYQDALPNFSTPYAIRFKDGGATADNAISQSFSTQQIKWNPALPLFAQIAYKRESSCDGTLTLTIGSKSASVVLSSGTDWTVLRFAVGQDAWFRRWNTQGSNPATACLVKVELSGNTTGTLLLDSFLLAPFTPLPDGSFLAIASGTTPFLRGDKWTATDTCSEGGVIQRWLALGNADNGVGGYYFPHSGSPTWADPTP